MSHFFGRISSVRKPKTNLFQKPKHTRSDTDRHGNCRWYTINNAGRKIRMQESPGTPAWFREYEAIRRIDPPLPTDPDDLPFVRRDVDRHGVARQYVISPAGQKFRMRAAPGSAKWSADYALVRSLPDDHPRLQSIAAISDFLAQRLHSEAEAKRVRNVEADLIRAIVKTKARAKVKGIGFDLDEKEMLQRLRDQSHRCALTGLDFQPAEIARAAGLKRPYSLSIDRVTPGGDYAPDNVRLVVIAVNVALLDWGESVFSTVAHAYVTNQKRKARQKKAPAASEPGSPVSLPTASTSSEK